MNAAAREDFEDIVRAAVERALPVVHGDVMKERRRRRVRITARGMALAAITTLTLVSGATWLMTTRSSAPSIATTGALIAGSSEPIRAVMTPGGLQFSDGTQVNVAPGASAYVVALDPRGGKLRLERGAITASFRHREQTRWIVDTGAVEIEVTGTRFDVRWEPDTSYFALSMREGSVVLRGCGLDGRTARAGDVIETSCGTSDPAPARSADAESDGANTVPDSPSSARAAPKAASVHSPALAEPSWRAALRLDRSQEAFEEAKRGDFIAACENSTVDELGRLADAARQAHAFDDATFALETLRRRFAGTNEAARAAFDLGVLESDRGHSARGASWFDRYLTERPDGALTREALGRLVECREDAGDRVAAELAAKQYLARYPNGPHATLARRIVHTEAKNEDRSPE